LGHIAKALVTKEKKCAFFREAAGALAPVNSNQAGRAGRQRLHKKAIAGALIGKNLCRIIGPHYAVKIYKDPEIYYAFFTYVKRTQ